MTEENAGQLRPLGWRMKTAERNGYTNFQYRIQLKGTHSDFVDVRYRNNVRDAS